VADALTTVSRVLIAFDTVSSNPRVLDVGAGLAAALGATLEGLFVEDAGLLHLCGLPFAREISAVTGAWRGLATEEIERALRVEAARVERLLARAAEHARVPWSFATARGRLLAQAMAREADLMILDAAGPAAGARESLAQGRRHVPAPFAVFFDASPASFEALDLAERLASALGRELHILVAPGGESTDAAWKHARSRLAAGHAGLVIPLGEGRDALGRALRAHRSELLVHALPDVARSLEVLAGLVAKLSCPLLVVRGGAGASPRA